MMTTVNDSSSKYRTMRRGPAFPCAESACGHGASTARVRHGSGPRQMEPCGEINEPPLPAGRQAGSDTNCIGLIDSI